MTVRGELAPRTPRAPLRPRSRKRWAVAAAIAGVWLLLLVATGSPLAGTVLFGLLLAAVAGLWAAARCLGIGRDHPWLARLAARPWRDGQDVLALGLRHLPEVFIVTPSGGLLAPNTVELRMNPADLAGLTERMELGLISSSATEVYQEQISRRGIGTGSPGPVAVLVLADPAVPPGRYRIRQGRPAASAGWPAQPPAGLRGGGEAAARDAGTRVDLSNGGRTVANGSPTVAEPAPVPLLRLVSSGCVAETRASGARAGRGSAAELGLPAVPTVSRIHASFAFTEGHWRITGLGRNGVLLNGTPVAGEQVIRDGDCITWGRQPGALESRVEIGWDRALPSRPLPARPA